MYKAQSSSEHNKKKCEWKNKKSLHHNEINDMVAETVKKSMKEIFQTQMKSNNKCTRDDSNTDSDSNN
jgi:hypothetical protein